MGDAYDVFFSYHNRDHALVERVAQFLTRQGIRVFLDRWYLSPGQPWPQALEQTLAACGAVAVFVGADGLGPWQQRERDLALDRQAQETGFPVIPVLLSRADPALGFLKLNTWVDLSAGVHDADALAILAAAIRRQPPGPLAKQRIAALRSEVCPYRGLRPFREEDEPFFFGRNGFTETLATTLGRQPFVAVVGASGSGKSSVVRAGLIPRLRRAEGGLVWDAVSLVPGDRPLASLAAALLPLLEPDLTEVDRLAEVNKLAAHLTDGSVALRDVAARVLEKQRGTDRLLLFVDQWEELYTVCPDQQIRRAFITHLLQVATQKPVRVVFTMRGDFFGRALADRALSDQLQDAVVTIGPMTREELAETIVKPAEAVDLTFEPGLAQTILDDVGTAPGSLPLLEFLLEALWKERRGALLQYDAYHRLGRVPGAIAHRAEEVFQCGLNEAEQQAAQRLLIQMVRPGEGVEDTRQRAAMPHADPVAEATISKLADARLVVTEREAATGRETVEVAHEALIRGWQRLRGWIDQDREFLRTRERIAAQARLWEDEGRQPDRLLPPGRPLAEGEDLLATRRANLEDNLVAYIAASSAAEASRKKAVRVSERRQLLRARFAALAMLFLALIAAGFAYWWATERQKALFFAGSAAQNADRAFKTLIVAQRNESRALAALADNEVERGSPVTAVRVSLVGSPQILSSFSRPFVAEVEGALTRSLGRLNEQRRLHGHEGAVSSVAFHPDGRLVVTGSDDATARLWEAATGKEIAILRGHDAEVTSVAFSPDGGMIVTGSWDNTARLWDIASGRELAVLSGHEGHVSSVAFSADGRTVLTASQDRTARLWNAASAQQTRILRGHESQVSSASISPDGSAAVTASLDGTVRLWDLASGREIAVFRGHGAEVLSVAFSPNGRTVASASQDGTIRLWDLASVREIAVFRGHEALVSSVAFSPDGNMIVSASWDRTARLWDLASGKEVAILRGHDNWLRSAAFSPDGRTIVTGSWDGTARLWDIASGKPAVLRGHEGFVRTAAFSPDGRLIVTGSDDATARLWEAATGKEIAILHGHDAEVTSVAFSPDGQIIASASNDRAARLWERVTGKKVAVLRGHEASVNSVSFSPDGRMLVTASSDKTARLWDTGSGKQLSMLSGHLGDVMSAAFSPDGRSIVTSGDATARLWDVATGREVGTFRHQGIVLWAAFGPDGDTIVTANFNVTSLDNTAQVWNVGSGKKVAVLRGHEGFVHMVALSPDGRSVVTGSADSTARLWDVVTGKELAELRGHIGAVNSVAFSPDGRRVVTASSDKTARIWQLLPRGQALIDLACARVHNLPLTESDKQRFWIEDEWCTREVSAKLRVELGMEAPPPTPPVAAR